ncbi:MAG: AAA family ATPase [Candidatus Heimdallarchaeota archaeon]|nr:AAA family ATPase [Candidatus Heimdallarchaeota archaeon]
MEIQRLNIENLFGLFNYEIDFKQNQPIHIIYSPNGYGKTSILSLLYHLFNHQFDQLAKIRFDRFGLGLMGEEVSVKRNVDADFISLEFFSKKFNEFYLHIPTISEFPSDVILSYIERFLPELIRIDRMKWTDNQGKLFDLQEILKTFADRFPDQLRSDLLKFNAKFFPTWLDAIINSNKLKLIDTRRLFNLFETEGEHQTSVERAAQTLKRDILNVRQKADSLGQNRESTFPFRLIDEVRTKKEVNVNKLKKELRYITKMREKLMSTGILETIKIEQLTDIEIDESNKYVLSVYAEDVKEKFDIFHPLYEKITLFKEIIESQFDLKKIHINKDKGIELSMFNVHTKETILLKPSQLSSGEQHLIVLFFDLIFNSEPRSTILIDEPEISLHIAWQLNFIENLEKVAKLNNIKFIIATHSPQIINENWDNTIDLAESMEGND